MIHSCLVWFLWWLRHGAIGPFEATPVGVNVDWPEFWIYTFELVIHLSKVQQMALLFFSHFENSCCSGCPRDPSDLRSFKWSCSEQPETSVFCSYFRNSPDFMAWQGIKAGSRLPGVVSFFWLSGETCCAPNSLELESCYMPLWLTWTRARRGITHDS